MGIIKSMMERRYSLADLDRDMDTLFRGRSSATGVKVNESTALQCSAVFACVQLLAETVASLPLPVYRGLPPREKERAYNHHLYPLLHDAPNPEMTSFNFREAMQGHLVLWGNCYAEIDWDMSSGRIRGLWPLRPDRMRVARREGKLWYHYRLPNGTEVVLPSYRVWHIPGLGFDGIMGYSPIHMAREAIGLALATEEYGARFFGNGAKPGGVLQHPGKLGEPAQENLQKSWNEMHQGLVNQHRIAILEEGMKYQQVGIPPEDAQFLETRKFQRNEIASFFHIPPHMIGDLERATFSNIEQQSIEFVVYTMRPWFVRWEQSIRKNLMGPAERRQYFAEFLVQGLLRGDITSRYQAYATARQWGWMSADDIRELENQNPLPDGQGQIYYMPMNMLPASMAASINGDGRQSGILKELRSSRSALQRQRMANSYRRVFEDAGQRIVERETSNVLRAARKYLGERTAGDFNSWLDDFYRDFPEYITRQISPVVRGLAEAIEPLASDEVNAAGGMTPEMDKFLVDYVSAFNARYTDSSRGQLRAIMEEAEEAGGEALPLVETRLEEWGQRRPGKVGMNETVKLSNAVAKVVFVGAGVTKLVWRAMGSESCPICQEMDGRVVGIEQDFVGKGETLKAEGQSDMKVYHPTSHPPLHEGCVCVIGPG